MAVCVKCGKSWPDHLVHPFYSSRGYEGTMDPICALERMRQVHGIPEIEFQGEQNKELYAEALRIQQSRAPKDSRPPLSQDKP